MKAKIIILAVAVVCVGLLGGCIGHYGKCKPKEIPAHIKLIDTENYNDVYTVYWNYFDNCLPNTDTVLICGYVGVDYEEYFYPYPFLFDDPIKALNVTMWFRDIHIGFHWNDSISNQVKSIIKASTPNKCYIKGVVDCDYGPIKDICDYHSFPKLKIVNVEDIYFKNN